MLTRDWRTGGDRLQTSNLLGREGNVSVAGPDDEMPHHATMQESQQLRPLTEEQLKHISRNIKKALPLPLHGESGKVQIK